MEATQRLLGYTITLSERAWQEPSRLPGWTRAHVASHIARNADGLIRSIEALLSDRPTLMYDGDEERDWAVERGSQRGGLDLQIDLDTTAGRLNTAFNQLEELAPDTPVELRPQHRLRADLLPLARLNEVVLHTADLDCGFEIEDLEPRVASWLLQWNSLVLPDTRLPDVNLRAEGQGLKAAGDEPASAVSGIKPVLLGWLTGRIAPDRAEVLGLPESPPTL